MNDKYRNIAILSGVLLVIFLISAPSHGSWITGLTKTGKKAITSSKGMAGVKDAAIVGVPINELDDAAKAAKQNLAQPALSEYETALIFNNHYPWAPVRLAACISKSSPVATNSSLVYCTSQYQKCRNEKEKNSILENLDEDCINQTNKEHRNANI